MTLSTQILLQHHHHYYQTTVRLQSIRLRPINTLRIDRAQTQHTYQGTFQGDRTSSDTDVHPFPVPRLQVCLMSLPILFEDFFLTILVPNFDYKIAGNVQEHSTLTETSLDTLQDCRYGQQSRPFWRSTIP